MNKASKARNNIKAAIQYLENLANGQEINEDEVAAHMTSLWQSFDTITDLQVNVIVNQAQGVVNINRVDGEK